MLEARALLATYTVTNVLNGVLDVGSLPWAVNQANRTTPKQLDFINFNIQAGGEHTITLSVQLFIVDQVVIDGTSQPGYNAQTKQPLIYVHGGPLVSSLFTLQKDTGNSGATSTFSTIQGLGMYSYSRNAVTIESTSTSNFIQDNWIGFRPNGPNAPFLTSTTFTAADGVQIESSSFNVVRGNTISGVRNGVVIGGGVTNAIQTNNIGTDPSGSQADGFGYRNSLDGIHLIAGAQQNFLGPDNVLSGNRYGIHLSHSTNAGNIAFRNMIGTNRAGDASIGNRDLGILLASGTSGNAVGGYYEGDSGNLVSGNANGGIVLVGASDNYVQKNIIGLNRAKTQAIGSQASGLFIAGGVRNVVQENVMAGHREHGILMQNTESNYLSKNYIGIMETGTRFANGGYGIALLSGASRNFVLLTSDQQNIFGDNLRGNLFVDPAAVGNAFS